MALAAFKGLLGFSTPAALDHGRALTPAELRAREEGAAISATLAGDTARFRLLVERYRPSLQGLVVRVLGGATVAPPCEVEDLVQQSFVNAFHSLNDYRSDYRFSTWLFRIAINLTKDHLKSKKRLECALGDDVLDGEALFSGHVPATEETLERRRLGLAIERALARLPWKYRLALVLKDVEERPYEEIRAILRLPITTLKIRVVRARRMLLELLGPRGDR